MIRYDEKVFSSTINDGPMRAINDFYSNTSNEEIIQNLKLRRIALGEKYGFDGTKIVIPSQDILLEKHSMGHFEDVTEIINDTLNDDPNYDLWNLDIPCDIMLVNKKAKGVVLAYPVADSPVVMLRAKDTLAIAHIPLLSLERGLPVQLVDAICKVANAKDNEISAYIGPCARSVNLSRYWLKNDNLRYFVTETSEGYSVNIRKAILSQLMKRGVSNVTCSQIDTITNNDYYSFEADRNGNKSKNGKFLTGIYFEEKEKTKRKIR